MTQLIETQTEPAREDPEALFIEARQRRRRRWLIGGIVIVVLTAGVISAVVIPSAKTAVRPPANKATTATTPRTPPVPAGKMADLVWAGSASPAVGSSRNATQLILGDAVSGTVRRLGGPIMLGCGGCAIVRVGNSLFVGEADGIYRLDRPRYRAIKIANGQIVFPATVPGRLLVASASSAEPQGDNVHLITTTGKDLGGPWQTPQGYSISSPPRATTEGIVVQKVIAPISPSASPTVSPTMAIWNPMTGSISHVLDLGARLIDTTTVDGHTTVAWLRELRGHCFNPGGDCQLVLTDLTTGIDRVIAPPGGLGFMGGGAFSPDGKTLAAFALVNHGKLNNDTMQLALIDVVTGKVSPVSKSTGQFGEPYGFATWSPGGQSVFFGGVGQIRTSFQDLRIGAYQIGASSATAIPFPVNYSAVAVNH